MQQKKKHLSFAHNPLEDPTFWYKLFPMPKKLTVPNSFPCVNQSRCYRPSGFLDRNISNFTDLLSDKSSRTSTPYAISDYVKSTRRLSRVFGDQSTTQYISRCRLLASLDSPLNEQLLLFARSSKSCSRSAFVTF